MRGTLDSERLRVSMTNSVKAAVAFQDIESNGVIEELWM